VFVDDRPLQPNVMPPGNTRAYSSGSSSLKALSWKDQLRTNTSLFNLFVSYKDKEVLKLCPLIKNLRTKPEWSN
jgi:hypothetical protein